jgi:hypothetical protein
MIDKEIQINLNVDYKNLVLVMREQLGFSAVEAKEAARYAVAELPMDSPFESMLQEAVKFLGQENNKILYTKARNN